MPYGTYAALVCRCVDYCKLWLPHGIRQFYSGISGCISWIKSMISGERQLAWWRWDTIDVRSVLYSPTIATVAPAASNARAADVAT